MIKLSDRVTFGRAGEKKVAGRVVKLNPKTAHVKCSNGDVMSVSYGLIQKPSSKRKAPVKRKPIVGGPYKPMSAKMAESLIKMLEVDGLKGTQADFISVGYLPARAKKMAADLAKYKRKPTKRNPYGSFAQTRAPRPKLTPGMQEFKILMHGTPVVYLEKTKGMLKRRKAVNLAAKIKIIDAEIRRQERL